MRVKAKKSYGQHFLTDEDMARDIAQSLSLSGYELIFEIGPGTGRVSKYLFELDIERRLVDADRDMIAHMRKHYPDHADELIESDVLKYDFTDHAGDRPFAIVGNFPYNISSQIVFKAIDHREQMPELVGMFQLEVAERICADHGSKKFGIISVLTQVYYDAELILHVPPESFNPPPKVDSAVIRLTRKQKPFPEFNERLLKRVVKQSFNQRRKMMRNTLKGVFDAELLNSDPIFTKRPEHLAVGQFIDIINQYENQEIITN